MASTSCNVAKHSSDIYHEVNACPQSTRADSDDGGSRGIYLWGPPFNVPFSFFHPTPPPWLTGTSPHNPPSSKSSSIRSTTSTAATFISWSVSSSYPGSCSAVAIVDERGRSKTTSTVYIATSSSTNRAWFREKLGVPTPAG